MVTQSASGCHSARLLLRRVHHGTRNLGLSSSISRKNPTRTVISQIFAETSTLTASVHLALLPILHKIAVDSDSWMGDGLKCFSGR